MLGGLEREPCSGPPREGTGDGTGTGDVMGTGDATGTGNVTGTGDVMGVVDLKIYFSLGRFQQLVRLIRVFCIYLSLFNL